MPLVRPRRENRYERFLMFPVTGKRPTITTENSQVSSRVAGSLGTARLQANEAVLDGIPRQLALFTGLKRRQDVGVRMLSGSLSSSLRLSPMRMKRATGGDCSWRLSQIRQQ